MAEMVQIALPEEVAQRAREVAQRTGRRFEDVLHTWLAHAAENLPVDMLSDAQVIALSEMTMDEDLQAELSDLLYDQREEQLDDTGRGRLDELMQVYRADMVRKSEALRVAVQRGLRPPLT
jgi:antitoxin component of RelBE/YafQ-DinJ toxin-antitoxin module